MVDDMTILLSVASTYCNSRSPPWVIYCIRASSFPRVSVNLVIIAQIHGVFGVCRRHRELPSPAALAKDAVTGIRAIGRLSLDGMRRCLEASAVHNIICCACRNRDGELSSSRNWFGQAIANFFRGRIGYGGGGSHDNRVQAGSGECRALQFEASLSKLSLLTQCTCLIR